MPSHFLALRNVHDARGGRDDSHRITISYTDRDTPSDDSGNFKVELKDAHVGSDVSAATMLWASVPSTAQTITDDNNKITVTATGEGTITLTNGTYDASTLATHIAAQMTASGDLTGTFTGSFDTVTNKITISIDVGTFSIDQSSTANALTYIAGLTSEGVLSSTLTDLEFPNVVGLVWPYIILEIPELSMEVPLEWNVAMGGYALTTNTYRERYRTVIGRRVHLHQLSFIVKNPLGNILNLGGGMTACEILLE